MTLATFVVLIYGLFTLVGGVIGYVKAKSKASLIAGTISGVVLLGCAYGFTEGVGVAYWISLIVALVLGIRFTKKWVGTHRVMPDLLMIIFSVATLVVVGFRFLLS